MYLATESAHHRLNLRASRYAEARHTDRLSLASFGKGWRGCGRSVGAGICGEQAGIGAGASALQTQLVAYRRYFHQYPELGWLEFDTTQRIAEHLSQLGYRVTAGEQFLGSVERIGLPADLSNASDESSALASLYVMFRIAKNHYGQAGRTMTWSSPAPYAALIVVFGVINIVLCVLPMAMRKVRLASRTVL
ncbi:MAG TPA: hypothetical protein VFR15_10285 [Chloroflexia bacterium]|nr:hypothetical protein [Chloroflexia bacterium]